MSDAAPTARALSSSSRSNPIASDRPRPDSGASCRSAIPPSQHDPGPDSTRGAEPAAWVNTRPLLRRYRSSRNSQADINSAAQVITAGRLPHNRARNTNPLNTGYAADGARHRRLGRTGARQPTQGSELAPGDGDPARAERHARRT